MTTYHHNGSRPGRWTSGFTLVELMVVVAILALLVTLLVTSLSTVIERSRRAACLSNLRQIGVALPLYAADHRGVVPPSEKRPHSYVPTRWFWADNSTGPWVADDGQGIQGLGHLVGTYLDRGTVFFCPSYNNQSQFGFNSGSYNFSGNFPGARSLSAYVYRGCEQVVAYHNVASFSMSQLASKAAIIEHRSASLNGHGPTGGNVLYYHGSAKWVDSEAMVHVNSDPFKRAEFPIADQAF